MAGVGTDIWLEIQRLAERRNADSKIARRIRGAAEPNHEIDELRVLLWRILRCERQAQRLSALGGAEHQSCLVSTFIRALRKLSGHVWREWPCTASCADEDTDAVIIMIRRFSIDGRDFHWNYGVPFSSSTFIRRRSSKR